jgi:broad specificity phosphatase PhoE
VSQILLVRHGQASFGAADYDQLSDLGQRQSTLLGGALAARGIAPDLVVSGGMRRHDQTAAAVLEGAGWARSVEVDRSWAEFDHEAVLAAYAQVPGIGDLHARVATHDDPRRAFQEIFDAATTRWMAGELTGADAAFESFADFTGRVSRGLDDLATRLGRGETALVLTSGGPIAWAAARLLGGDESLWARLNLVIVNTGVTKIVTGSRGATLVSLNDHSHVDGPDRSLLTSR